MHILIIDDEWEVACTLAAALEEGGHTSTLARNGAEGLTRLQDESPDAVFLDIRLPGLSGVDVLREIRRRTRPHLCAECPSCPRVHIGSTSSHNPYVDNNPRISYLRSASFCVAARDCGRYDP